MREERKALSFSEIVELNKDYSYWERKFNQSKERLLKNLRNEEESLKHVKELAYIEETLLRLQGIIQENVGVSNLRYAIYEKMKENGWDQGYTAQQAGVTLEIVKECMAKGNFLASPDHTHFGMWAIETFNLDANCYIRYFRG